jgi:hypothetical protein
MCEKRKKKFGNMVCCLLTPVELQRVSIVHVLLVSTPNAYAQAQAKGRQQAGRLLVTSAEFEGDGARTTSKQYDQSLFRVKF